MQKRPIVFLHGFLGSSSDWLELLSYLPPCNYHLIDLPGHGKSTFQQELILPNFEEKMILIGYSMGGRLALQYAASCPEKVEKLILLSTHLGLFSEEERKKRWEKDLFVAKKLTSMPIDDFLKEWYDQPLFGGFCPSLSFRRKGNPQEMSRALLRYSLGKMKPCHFENKILMVGEKDEKYRTLYPEAIVIKNAAHALHLEKAQKVAACIEKEIL